MSLSSINFQTAKGNSSSHMSRDSFVSYLIEHDNNHFEYKHYQDPKEYLELALIQTKLLTKRSMQSSAIKNFTQEAVLNIKKDTTIQDVENLFKKFSETKFKEQKAGGFKVFEIALHKDEGVFVDTKYDVEDLVFDSKTLKIYKDNIDVSDEVISYAPNKDIFYNSDTKKWYKDKDFKTEFDTSKLQKKMNYHAHISFTKWDENTGKNIRLQKSDLQNIQTITAREMKMERGQENSQSKRLNHYQIKKLQSENNSQKIGHRELKLVTVPQLQTDNINLKNELLKLKEEQKLERAELQKSGAVRSDYAALEQKYRDLKAALLEILPTATKPIEVLQYVQELKNDLSQALESKNELSEVNHTLRVEKMDLKVNQSDLNKQVEELKKENEKLNWYKKQYQAIVSSLKKWTKLDDIKAVMQNLKERFEAPKAFETVEEFEKALPLRSIYTATVKIREGLEASNEPPLLKIEKLQVLDEFERQRLEAALPNAKITLNEHLEQAKPQMDTCLSNNIQDFNSHYAEKQGMSR